MPSFPLVDTHLHLWDLSRWSYPWLAGEPRLNQSHHIEDVIASFGFDRVMFGGDWPVSTLASDYPRWVRTLDAALPGATPDELRKLYVRNAESFYRV